VKVEPLLLESREKAAEFLYQEAFTLLGSARAGNKVDAREAYERLIRVDKFYTDYKDKESMIAEAVELGKNHVQVQLLQTSDAIIPRDLERELMSISLDGLNSLWVEYHTETSDQTPDYSVVINLRSLDVSPEQYREERFTETAEIEDGVRYVLDDNGNVAKDTTGNDITEPNIVEVSCDVIQTIQIKESIAEGTIDFFDRRTSNLLKTEDITSNAVFEHYTSNYRGDERALSDRGREYLNSRPAAFPSDEQMIYDAVTAMKPEIRRYLVRHKGLFEQ